MVVQFGYQTNNFFNTMIKTKKTNNGERLTLDGLMTELNNLFASRKDDPKTVDIKSMIQSLVNGEACFEEEESTQEGIDISDEDLSGGMIGYDCLYEAVNAKEKHTIKDMLGDYIPMVAFISTENMMEGVVDTIRAMKFPTIIAAETTDSGKLIVTKAFVACGETRTNLLENGATLPALVFDEKSGMCRMSINRKDGYDFIIGENKNTRFIIFDENVCPATIPTDIVSDDHKWGKRMSSELPKLIEKRIEENKKTPLCNLPETCTFEDCPHDVKNPLIADIMKDFADAKSNGKVGKDTFVEFMKPENKEAVANAIATSIAERQKLSEDVIEKDEVTKAVESAIYENAEDDFTDEDTNPDCFRCIAEYMAKEGVDTINFYTDCEGLIHCDVRMKTVYKVELEDSDKK